MAAFLFRARFLRLFSPRRAWNSLIPPPIISGRQGRRNNTLLLWGWIMISSLQAWHGLSLATKHLFGEPRSQNFPYADYFIRLYRHSLFLNDFESLFLKNTCLRALNSQKFKKWAYVSNALEQKGISTQIALSSLSRFVLPIIALIIGTSNFYLGIPMACQRFSFSMPDM